MAPLVTAEPGDGRRRDAGRDHVMTPEGRRIAFIDAGAGEDVVLIHGMLMTADDMDIGLRATLSPRFHCVAVDRPGHGWSDHRRGADASLFGQVETIRSAVRSLGLRRPILCGHSLGGAIALAYGMQHPEEIAGIVALAPICFPEPRLEHILFAPRAFQAVGPILSDLLNATVDPVMLPALWSAMFLPQAMPEDFAARFPFAVARQSGQLVADGENAAALWPDLTLNATRYSACRVPVRILAGGADLVVNTYTQGAMAAVMIPQAHFEVLPGIGHMLHHFRPDAVAAALHGIADVVGDADRYAT